MRILLLILATVGFATAVQAELTTEQAQDFLRGYKMQKEQEAAQAEAALLQSTLKLAMEKSGDGALALVSQEDTGSSVLDLNGKSLRTYMCGLNCKVIRFHFESAESLCAVSVVKGNDQEPEIPFPADCRGKK